MILKKMNKKTGKTPILFKKNSLVHVLKLKTLKKLKILALNKWNKLLEVPAQPTG